MAKRKEAQAGPLSLGLKNNTNPTLIRLKCGLVPKCGRCFNNPKSFCRHIGQAHFEETIKAERVEIYDFCSKLNEIDSRTLAKIIEWSKRGILFC